MGAHTLAVSFPGGFRTPARQRRARCKLSDWAGIRNPSQKPVTEAEHQWLCAFWGTRFRDLRDGHKQTYYCVPSRCWRLTRSSNILASYPVEPVLVGSPEHHLRDRSMHLFIANALNEQGLKGFARTPGLNS